MSFPKLLVVATLRVASFAGAKPAIEEPAFDLVARQSERGAEVLARDLVPATAKLELAERRGIERICGEAIAIGDRADLLEPTLGTLRPQWPG